MKQFDNLLYCFTCGYNVDHDRYHCLIGIPGHHCPEVIRELAHTVNGACMKAQHKTLADRRGLGGGWILAQSVSKA